MKLKTHKWQGSLRVRTEPLFWIGAGALIVAMALVIAIGAGGAEAPAKEEVAEPPGRVKRNAEGEVILTLDAGTRKVMGLETAKIEATQVASEIKAYGRVMDISPLASLVADLITAQAASDASQAELKRLQTLTAQSNASQRVLEAAEAAAVRDRTRVESTRLRLVAGWGMAIADRKDLPGFVQSLVSLSDALVEVDVPGGQVIGASPKAARLLSLGEDAKPIEAEFIGLAPAVDPQMQGHGFLFLVRPNRSRLAPGAAVTGYMSMPGEAEDGILLPRDAIVRYNGLTWVYQQKTEDTFERVPVKLERPLAKGWFVREKLKPEDKVVVVGAQQMLSEELKGQIEE